VDLNNHQIEHSNFKPFKCPKCEHRSNYKTNMARHMTRHSQTDKSSFQCQLCVKTFKSSRDLTRHKIFHSDGKPFECPKCEHKTKYKRALAEHIKSIHEKTQNNWS